MPVDKVKFMHMLLHALSTKLLLLQKQLIEEENSQKRQKGYLGSGMSILPQNVNRL